MNKKFLSIKDIVFMNIISIVSLRQVLNAAPYGASSIILWLIAAFCFFMPLALVCKELCAKYPTNGGMFIWIKESFGTRVAWVISIYYLVSCIVFFPMLLFFGFSTIATMLHIKNQNIFIMIFGMLTFLLLTYFNILGVKYISFINKFLMYLGIFIPVLILSLLALLQMFVGGGISH